VLANLSPSDLTSWLLPYSPTFTQTSRDRRSLRLPSRMGAADGNWKAPTEFPDARRRLVAAFTAFPSPASVSSAVNTPLLERAPKDLRSSSGPVNTPRHELFESAISAVPDTIHCEPVLTPPANDIPEPSLNMILGGSLAPTSEASIPQSSQRSRPDLQLPSFDMLGIAVPHPDRFGAVPLDGSAIQDLTPGSLDMPDGSAEISIDLNSLKLEVPPSAPSHNPLGAKLPGTGVRSPAQYCGDPLTPPDDVPYIDWNNSALTSHAMSSKGEQPGQEVSGSEQVQAGAQESTQSGSTRRSTGSLSGQPFLWFHGALQTIRELKSSMTVNIATDLSSRRPSFCTCPEQQSKNTVSRITQPIAYWPRFHQHHHRHSGRNDFCRILDQCIPRGTRTFQPCRPTSIATNNSWSSGWRYRLLHREDLRLSGVNCRLPRRSVATTSVTSQRGPTVIC